MQGQPHSDVQFSPTSRVSNGFNRDAGNSKIDYCGTNKTVVGTFWMMCWWWWGGGGGYTRRSYAWSGLCTGRLSIRFYGISTWQHFRDQLHRKSNGK